MAINESWEENDEGPDAAIDSSIRYYLNNVMRVVVAKYSEHFHGVRLASSHHHSINSL